MCTGDDIAVVRCHAHTHLDGDAVRVRCAWASVAGRGVQTQLPASHTQTPSFVRSFVLPYSNVLISVFVVYEYKFVTRVVRPIKLHDTSNRGVIRGPLRLPPPIAGEKIVLILNVKNMLKFEQF